MIQIFRVLVATLAVSAIACSSEPPTTGGSEGAVKTPPAGTTPAPIGTTPTPVAAGTATTPTPAGTTPPPGGACAPQANDPCELCVVQKCCAQIQAFEADPQAQAYGQCFAQCDSAQTEQQYAQCMQQKQQQCAAAAPSAAQKDQAIGACAQQGCAAQCQG